MPYGFTSVNDNSSANGQKYSYGNNYYTQQSLGTILGSGAQGAAIGASLGSAIPGVGTILGGALGFVFGGLFGGRKNDAEQKKKKAEYNTALEKLMQGESDLINSYNQELELYNIAQEQRINNYNTDNQKSTMTLLGTQMQNAQTEGRANQQVALSGFRNTAGAMNNYNMTALQGEQNYQSQKLSATQNSQNAFTGIQTAFTQMSQSTSNLDTMLERYQKAYQDLKNGNDITQELEVISNWSNAFKSGASLVKSLA